MTQGIEYVPPSMIAIYTLACEVCQQMAEHYQDEGYVAKQVIDGLANYLRIVAHIEAAYLTRQRPVDNAAE